MTSTQPLRVAVAGTSFASTVQIPVFQSHPRTRVIAVSSGREARARSVARDLGIAASYTDFETMLDQERPDVVSIVTPPSLHFPFAIAALSRGIHVLCEKPFARSSDEARQMLDAAREAGVVAMVDFEFRQMPGRAYLRELLHQNYVGQIRLIEFLFYFGWRSKEKDVGWTWWSDRGAGGGALGALGSHAVDSVCYWMGSRPQRVFCQLSIFVPEREGREVSSDDGFTMLLEFPSGARATLQISAAAGVESSRIGIYGSEGQLVIPDFRAEELVGGKRSTRKISKISIPERYRLPSEPGHVLRAPFRSLLNKMVDAIDNHHASPHPNFQDGLLSQEILDAARRSSDDGRWVALA